MNKKDFASGCRGFLQSAVAAGIAGIVVPRPMAAGNPVMKIAGVDVTRRDEDEQNQSS
jgi:hypothetical protein